MARTNHILMSWWSWRRQPLCTRPIRWIGFYRASWLIKQSADTNVDMLLHWNT